MYIKFKFYKLELSLYVFFPYICTWKHIFFIFVLESARAMKCWHKVSVGRVIVISFSTQMLDPVGRGVTPFITLHKRTARFHYWSLDPPPPYSHATSTPIPFPFIFRQNPILSILYGYQIFFYKYSRHSCKGVSLPTFQIILHFGST